MAKQRFPRDIVSMKLKLWANKKRKAQRVEIGKRADSTKNVEKARAITRSLSLYLSFYFIFPASHAVGISVASSVAESISTPDRIPQVSPSAVRPSGPKCATRFCFKPLKALRYMSPKSDKTVQPRRANCFFEETAFVT